MHDHFPLPDLEAPDSREFWVAARRGELVVPRCRQCGRWVWYPKDECPQCNSAEMPWTVTSGTGSLFSWTVVERVLLPEYAPIVPYVTGLVSISDDPKVRIVTRIVDVEPTHLRAGMDLRAVFRAIRFLEPDHSVVVPFFVPAETAA